MADTHVADDAPATASTRHDGAAQVADSVPEAKGSAVIGRAVTINRPPSELYAYWRDQKNLATFMENVVEITPIDDTVSRWVVKAPAGKTVEWNARITEDVPDRSIAWTSEPGADVANSGRVEFRDAAERGTVVVATILYDPPAGFVGKIVAKLFQREPGIQARRDLRRFKQLMETGEIATAAMNSAQFEEEQG